MSERGIDVFALPRREVLRKSPSGTVPWSAARCRLRHSSDEIAGPPTRLALVFALAWRLLRQYTSEASSRQPEVPRELLELSMGRGERVLGEEGDQSAARP